MNNSKITLVAGVVLIVAVFALVGGSWSSATAAELDMPNCVDAYAGGPDFLFNARPASLKAAYGDNCLTEVFVDNGPTFLVNAHAVSTGSLERLAECPQVQSGAPTFLVNAEPTVKLNVAGIEGQCIPG